MSLDSDHRPLFCGAAAMTMAAAAAAIRPAWHDELYTLALSRMSFANALSALGVDSGPPLHYLLVGLLRAAMPTALPLWLEVLALRLPSVVAFALLVALLAKARRPSEFPWAATLVLAWLPALYFASEARAYALLALAVTWLWLRAPSAAESARGAAAIALVATAVPLLHNTGILHLGALALGGWRLPTVPRRRYGLALLLGALPFMAWLPILLRQPRASLDWMVGTGSGIAALRVWSPAGPFPALFELDPNRLAAQLGLAALAVLAGGLAVSLTRLLWRREAPASLHVLVGLSPVAALMVASRLGWPLYFPGRSEIAVAPLLAVLVVGALAGIGRRGQALILAPFALVGIATEASWLSNLPGHAPAAGIRAGLHLAPVIGPHDTAIVVGLYELELRYGLELGDATLDIRTFPSAQGRHPGWFEPFPTTSGALVAEARELRRELGGKGGNIWLIRNPALPIARTLAPAFRDARRVTIHASDALIVERLTLPSAAPPPATTGPSSEDGSAPDEAAARATGRPTAASSESLSDASSGH